jgi:tetratricopeptide (TPR) repeat protein
VAKLRRSGLTRLIQRFVEADSWAASRVFVERHRALLSDDADEVLTGLLDAASARGDGAAAHTYEVHRAALRRYRECGAAAFDELIAPSVPAALRPRWVAAEAAYERYRGRPGRAAADAAVLAVTAVLQDDGLADVPAVLRAGMHQAAGTVYGERFQRYRGPAADLDAAVTCFSAAIEETSDDDPDRPSYVSALGNVLGMRYEQRGDPMDLDAGIHWSREAVRNMPDDERWWLLHNLSASLDVRYEMFGDLADLAEAVETARAALACDPPESARLVLASALASLLLDRYEREGTIDDLRSAINVAQAGDPEGPKLERAVLMAIRAVALDRYAERVHSPVMLDEAITLLNEAVRLLGRGSPHLAACLSALGHTHLTRFRDNGAPADLVAARDAFARALRHVDPRAPRAALYRSSMGTIEVTLATLDVPGFDLESAVSGLQAAADSGSRHPRIRPFLLANLAAGREAQYRRISGDEKLKTGVAAYQQACSEGLTHDLEVALNAARGWGDWATERQSWAEADTAYGIALDVADRLRQHQLRRPEKEIWLRSAQGLGSQAGHAATRAGHLERAVVQIERARAQLLAEELSLARLDLARLAVMAPDLAGRYAALASRLRSLDAVARNDRSGLFPRKSDPDDPAVALGRSAC